MTVAIISSDNVAYVNVLLSRKEEAVNRPKLEFVPKTLADLHVDSGLPTLDHMNGGNFSLHGKTHFTNTSTTPRDNTRVVWLFNCFLFLILFLSCQGGKGGRCLRIPTYYIDQYIAFSCLSLTLCGAPLVKYWAKCV